MKLRKYIVVNFTREKTRNGKSVIDLVPRSWVTLTSERGGSCRYPPPPFMNLINMVKSSSPPGLTWDEYPVMLMGSSDTYEEGITKCDKAEKTLSASTTDDEATQSKSSHIQALSLDDVPPYPSPKSPDEVNSGNIQDDTNYHSDGPSSAITPKKQKRHRDYCSDSEMSSTESPLKKKQIMSSHLAKMHSRNQDVQMNSRNPRSQLSQLSGSSMAPVQPPASANSFDIQIDTRTPCSRRPSQLSGSSMAPVQPPASDIQIGTRTPCSRRPSQLSGSSMAPAPASAKSFDPAPPKWALDMEKNILERIDKVRRSNMHEVKQIKTEMIQLRATVLKSLKGSDYESHKIVTDFETEWKLPLEDMETFDAFETSLQEKDKFADLVKVLQKLWVPTKSGDPREVKQSLAHIMERYMSKAVAMCFSAQGRGKLKKKNFSATQLFSALESVALADNAKTNAATVVQAVGKILACVGDWDGGRAEREEKRKKKQNLPNEGEGPTSCEP